METIDQILGTEEDQNVRSKSKEQNQPSNVHNVLTITTVGENRLYVIPQKNTH